MADDPIRKYLDARNEFDQATRNAGRLTDIIVEAGRHLQRWQEVTVSNVGVGFPAELIGGPSIDAHQWPTAEELAEVLASWHDARHTTRNAWRAVPDSDHQGLQSPP